jgi:methyl-accepting chemotaxis protein
MPDASSSSRRRIFIDKRFQTRFILNYTLLLLAGTALFIGAAYLILDKQIGESLFSAHLAISRTGELLLPTLLYLAAAFIVILGLATVVVTLLVSHKISGPLFAIVRYLRAMSEGNLNFEAKLRTNDQTAVVADTLTEAVRSLAGKVAMLKEIAGSLHRDAENVAAAAGRGGGSAETVRLAHELQEHIRTLEERLAVFQIE